MTGGSVGGLRQQGRVHELGAARDVVHNGCHQRVRHACCNVGALWEQLPPHGCCWEPLLRLPGRASAPECRPAGWHVGLNPSNGEFVKEWCVRLSLARAFAGGNRRIERIGRIGRIFRVLGADVLGRV